MPLLIAIIDALQRAGIRYAVAGASAMATDGVSRTTNAVDVFTTDTRALDPELLAVSGADVVIERRDGPAAAMLIGTAHIRQPGERGVDIIVGSTTWHSAAVERAEGAALGDVRVAMIRHADLILLKLHSGTASAIADIELLLDASDLSVVSEVDARAPALPAEARALWRQIRSAHLSPRSGSRL
jgi:hypothetical protein